ncbi:MAG: purine-binding chemotaxis protein CheW [Desulfovibrionales bacterium]|nr:purine-binding chemotaxis protein CheW [Desulfovibrionales bacterium]
MSDAATNQFLTFMLHKDIYALEISSVREVLEMAPITKIPRTPKYMRGVVNVRGYAAPVMDLCMKLGMGRVQESVETCIIMVEADFEGDTTLIGALVDSVREVYEMAPEDIEPAPKMGTDIDSEYIKGIGRQQDDFIIILENSKIFSAEELAAARSLVEAAGGDPQALSRDAGEDGDLVL